MGRQTGFNPAILPVGVPDAQTIQKSGGYFRAISACLDARGYTVLILVKEFLGNQLGDQQDKFLAFLWLENLFSGTELYEV